MSCWLLILITKEFALVNLLATYLLMLDLFNMQQLQCVTSQFPLFDSFTAVQYLADACLFL